MLQQKDGILQQQPKKKKKFATKSTVFQQRRKFCNEKVEFCNKNKILQPKKVKLCNNFGSGSMLKFGFYNEKDST